jgi:DNA-binding transcriptional regulator YiaG
MIHPLQSPDAFREAQRKLRLSASALAAALLVSEGRTVRRWQSGERQIPGPVAVLLQTWLDHPETRPDPSPFYED